MNILIVDDEELIRSVIKEYLILNNYFVFEACDGFESIEIVKKNNIDLIIMDIMMPNMDGFTAIKEINKIKKIPSIMLSAKAGEDDKLKGFDLGIEDYVTKPFSPKELMARVKVILKRNNDNITKVLGINLDDIAHEVYIDGKEIILTPKEYELLKYFMQNKNIALSREILLKKIWGYDFYGDDRTIDTHVKMLRNHLGPYRNTIKTIREVGYKFEIR